MGCRPNVSLLKFQAANLEWLVATEGKCSLVTTWNLGFCFDVFDLRVLWVYAMSNLHILMSCCVPLCESSRLRSCLSVNCSVYLYVFPCEQVEICSGKVFRGKLSHWCVCHPCILFCTVSVLCCGLRGVAMVTCCHL